MEKSLRSESKPGSERALMVATALITFAAALGVSGGTNLWMLLTRHELIKKHRPTLTFRSAIFGDGVILPVVNWIMMKSFMRWRPHLTGSTALVPIVGGSAVSLVFHIG